MTAVHLRSMEESDLPVVASIEAAAFSAPWSESSIRELLDQPRTRSLVAIEGPDRVVGYAIWLPVAGQAELMNLAVAPTLRGSGIGRLLLDRVIEESDANGIHEIYLEVRPTNDAALGLYRGAGFERIAVRRDYYRLPREDAWVLRRVGAPREILVDPGK